MSRKYLGKLSDIHGGGLDLMFPHHECEIAQSQGSAARTDEARFWVHNNMITVNGTKMSKSLGNFVLLGDMFRGPTGRWRRGYSPMVVRFFLLQAHYRSPVDVSDEALQAARKGYRKLLNGLRLVEKLAAPAAPVAAPDPEKLGANSKQLTALSQKPAAFLDDDLNTPRALAALFDLLKRFNTLAANPARWPKSSPPRCEPRRHVPRVRAGRAGAGRGTPPPGRGVTQPDAQLLRRCKAAKAYDKVDQIRAALRQQGIVVKDTRAGVEWAYSEE